MYLYVYNIFMVNGNIFELYYISFYLYIFLFGCHTKQDSGNHIRCWGLNPCGCVQDKHPAQYYRPYFISSLRTISKGTQDLLLALYSGTFQALHSACTPDRLGKYMEC